MQTKFSRLLNSTNYYRYILLNISRHIKRMVRAIEAIPLHLTIDIIRLDDALGQSWGLPLQACATWEVSNWLINIIFSLTGMRAILANMQVILPYTSNGCIPE